MFSDLTAGMRENLETALPRTAFTKEDDTIPVVAKAKVKYLVKVHRSSCRSRWGQDT